MSCHTFWVVDMDVPRLAKQGQTVQHRGRLVTEDGIGTRTHEGVNARRISIPGGKSLVRLPARVDAGTDSNKLTGVQPHPQGSTFGGSEEIHRWIESGTIGKEQRHGAILIGSDPGVVRDSRNGEGYR